MAFPTHPLDYVIFEWSLTQNIVGLDVGSHLPRELYPHTTPVPHDSYYFPNGTTIMMSGSFGYFVGCF